ncbi:MAG: UDP-2,3-diacylglucosamine diphosphatase [Lautropia sp.]|nr:UDP-2,3-diacylglucosamine diphosphatase [Lautropia sp.]
MSTAAPFLRIDRPSGCLFASDMHLDDRDRALCERFLTTLDRRLRQALADQATPVLFLLGDLFEYWVGDDTPSPVADRLAERLRAFASQGGRSFLMHGNRDFLLDVPLSGAPEVLPYGRRADASLLTDPTVIEVAGRRIVLSHGDVLCTDDLSYQQWRRQCRCPAWQQKLLAMPMAERIAMARALRSQSQQAQQAAEMLADVNQAAVDAMMDQTGCDLLIHGHTHRPALHHWRHGDQSRQRWVLSDWGHTRGSVMSLEEGLALPALP